MLIYKPKKINKNVINNVNLTGMDWYLFRK